MITNDTFRQLALSHPNVEELPHFEIVSFRVKKKIFATLNEKKCLAMVRLSIVDQSAFCSFDKAVIYPVPGGWGKQGGTYIDLKKVKKTTLKDALSTAYGTISTKK